MKKPYIQRLIEAKAIDLRDNHRTIDHGNGYTTIEPIDRSKTIDKSMFFCYSTTLMHFLKANGLRYEYKTKHKRTGNRMWVFKRTDELRRLLDEYDARKAAAKREGRMGE